MFVDPMERVSPRLRQSDRFGHGAPELLPQVVSGKRDYGRDAGRTLTDAARLLPTPRASDGAKGCPAQRGSHGDLALPSAAVRVRTLPTPTASEGRGPGGHGKGGADLRTAVAGLPLRSASPTRRCGGYAAAVARWEVLLGRPAPTQPGRHRKPVLVEWLIGLPPGWVTDLDLPRTPALRVLCNGVVPQQVVLALRLLLCQHRWALSP